jgi:hypothetical protein
MSGAFFSQMDGLWSAVFMAFSTARSVPRKSDDENGSAGPWSENDLGATPHVADLQRRMLWHRHTANDLMEKPFSNQGSRGWHVSCEMAGRRKK